MTWRRVVSGLAAAGLLVGATAVFVWVEGEKSQDSAAGKALKSVTINTGAYNVAPRHVDRRTESIMADEDMRIVGIEHFTGVQGRAFSDNGHMLSLSEENAWTKWEKAGTGMEPTGTKGYFGYCGRDYYAEVGGIDDVMAYEMMPAGTHILVPKGQRLYMHCYANNFSPDRPKAFHHAVRLLYW